MRKDPNKPLTSDERYAEAARFSRRRQDQGVSPNNVVSFPEKRIVSNHVTCQLGEKAADNVVEFKTRSFDDFGPEAS
jgi:hypothetical protein